MQLSPPYGILEDFAIFDNILYSSCNPPHLFKCGSVPHTTSLANEDKPNGRLRSGLKLVSKFVLHLMCPFHSIVESLALNFI